MTQEFPCSRCGQPMHPHIHFIRLGNSQPIDVCDTCLNEIILLVENFIKSPPDHGTGGLSGEQKVRLADAMIKVKEW